MKTFISVAASLTVLACGFALGLARADGAKDQSVVALSRQQIEADWLSQAELRFRLAGGQTMTPEEDAAGGNDGVKDGKDVGYYGFHTDQQQGPWWQVDLEEQTALARVVIYNGSTPEDAKRALGIVVLVSEDGNTWSEHYRHDGTMFCGPKQPLTVELDNVRARYVRVQLPYVEYLHLDEIEVYSVGSDNNIALNKPSTQSSTCKWSKRELPLEPRYPAAEVVDRGLKLAQDLQRRGSDVGANMMALSRLSAALHELPENAPADVHRRLYLEAQWAVRAMALGNPLLDFDRILFVKRAPNRLLCHCDEYLSWWSRPGGELCILDGFKGDAPRLCSLTGDLLPPGDILRPDISYDGTKVLFAYCRHYPDLWQKLDKHCTRCHKPGVEGKGANTTLTAASSYQTLIDFGGDSSLHKHVLARYDARRSVPGACGTMASSILKLIRDGHYDVELGAQDMERLIIWMDTYGQVKGSHNLEQEERLRELRSRMAGLLTSVTQRP
jgi:hypothetical protein